MHLSVLLQRKRPIRPMHALRGRRLCLSCISLPNPQHNNKVPGNRYQPLWGAGGWREKLWCKSRNATKVINSDSKIGWGGFLPFWYLNCFGALVKDTRFSGSACGTSYGQRSPAPPTILHRLHWPTLLSRIFNVKAITSWKKNHKWVQLQGHWASWGRIWRFCSSRP